MDGVGGCPKIDVCPPLGGGGGAWGGCDGRILGPTILCPPLIGGAFPKIDEPTGGGGKFVSLEIGGAPSIEFVGGG